MYLMIDNYDSFVYNLARYFEELGEKIELVRNDRIDAAQIRERMEQGELEGVIVSPGPKSPSDCGNCAEIVRVLAGRVPVLGVCLGHQIIGHVFGADIRKGERPMHGKVTRIRTDGKRLFDGLPGTYEVTRYHSLVIDESSLPEELQVDAYAADGAIMAVSHKTYPIYGVQFHPEAVLTQYGHELLHNFTKLCRGWWENHENNVDQAFVLS